MIELEAQLLKIIEEQQAQLKQQQQALSNVLKLLELRNETIEHQESKNANLRKLNATYRERIVEQERILATLKNPENLTHHLALLRESYRKKLDSHLTDLVKDLKIESEAKALLERILPILVQKEIQAQLIPLALQMKEKFDSVSSYHEQFEVLIQKVSSRL